MKIDSTIDGRQFDATAVSLNKQPMRCYHPNYGLGHDSVKTRDVRPIGEGVGLMNGFSIKAVECVAAGGGAEKLFHYYCTRPSLEWTVAIAL